MSSLVRKSVAPFGVLAVAVLFLVIMAIISMSGVTHAAGSTSSDRGRLITIHDRGTEKVILSEATTIGDAIKEANITLDSKDVVEPAVDEKLIASDYQVNIYRARPIIIVDGNIRQKVMTPYQTADQIAANAGIVLYPEDKTAIGRVDNLAEGAGLQLTITRSTPFSFTLYGKTTTVRTQGKTIGEMLIEKGIKLSQDDRVLPSQDSALVNGMAVRVWREGKQTISIDEPVDFDVEKIQNANQQVGYLEITTPGVTGLRSVTYEVTIQDGQEVSRTEIASVIVNPAIKQVEVVGVKGEYTTPSENENITWSFLIDNGFSREQTAGIMGNLMQEHGFKTSDTSGGLGIAQWTDGGNPGFGRKSALLSRSNPYNIYTQLSYLMEELNGSYRSTRDAIMLDDSVDPKNVTIIFQKEFEKCGVCKQDSRIDFARNILASH